MITDHWPVRDDWEAIIQFNAPLRKAAPRDVQSYFTRYSEPFTQSM